MAASKTVNPVNPSPTVSPQRAYLFEAHLHILFPDYFKLLTLD